MEKATQATLHHPPSSPSKDRVYEEWNEKPCMRQRVGALFPLYFLSFCLTFPSSRPFDDHPSLCTAPRPTGPFSFLVPAHLVFAFSPPQVRPPLVHGLLVLTHLAPNTCLRSLRIAGDPLPSKSLERTRKTDPGATNSLRPELRKVPRTTTGAHREGGSLFKTATSAHRRFRFPSG